MKNYILFQIQIEDIFPSFYAMNPQEYLGFLKELCENIENDMIDSFFNLER